jgi:receptor expression-enhancing protein 1/2/3/4
MISVFFSRLVILTAGTLYPAYRSYKAVRTKDVKEYVKWMMYWIVFALFCFAESISDIFVAFWFPFYYELKIIFVLWLLSPWTKGASILYRRWIHPLFQKHEDEIDTFLENAKSESYKQAVTLGQRSLMYARDIVATAAIRGQAQLAQQIQRSYSMDDVNRNDGTFSRRTTVRVTEIQEEEEDDVQIIEEEGDYENFDGDAPPEEPHPRRPRRTRTVRNADDPATEPIYNTLPRRSARRNPSQN